MLSRCFIPIGTVNRIVVCAPDQAEYETGFQTWVERVGNLARQLACRVVFVSTANTCEYIRNLIEAEKFAIRQSYRTIQSWDDFIIFSGEVGEEDLFILIAARKGSISYRSETDGMSSFLSKNFSRHNLLIIYPGQFGTS